MRPPFSIFSDTIFSMRKTVLIFGASSFVGSNLITELSTKYRLIGTYKETPLALPGVTMVKCDALKRDRVNHIIGLFKPDITIYAGGMSSITGCHNNPKLADALNSAALINVCSSAERFSSKFIFLSSCFVLSGENVVYHESDTPFPSTVYGSALASSEFYVQKSCLNYVIFRTSPLIGKSYHPKRRNWIESIEASVAIGQTVAVDDHVEHGHLDIGFLAKLIIMAIDTNVTNRLFQVSSKDVLSRYDFSRLYSKKLGLEENLITRTQWNFPVDESQFRGKKIDIFKFQMDAKNAEDYFKIKMPSASESIDMMIKRLSR
jgi:dTDP-4-dehydrorhamnose reductase